MPIDNHDKDILHSLYGRRLGIDNRGLLTGLPDIRHGTETITSTVASTLAPAGTSILGATVSGVYDLTPPSASMVGVCKRLIHNSTVAGLAMLVKFSTGNAGLGNFMTLLGTSQNTLSLTTRGTVVDLEYISSAFVSVVALNSTSTSGAVLLTTTT